MAKNVTPTDPAAAMLAAMTPEQRAAYYKALGQEPPPDEPAPDASRGMILHAPPGELTAPLAELYESAAGQGLECAEAGDFLTPTLKLLQALSDEVSQQLLPGAASGDWCLTSTGELWGGDDGPVVIPCDYRKEFVEYVPRNAGGGFVAVHAVGDPIVKTFRYVGRRMSNPATGNDVQETFRIFALVQGADRWHECVTAFKSTGAKTAKRLLTLSAAQRLTGANGPFNPPMRAFCYQYGSERRTNDDGTFHVPSVTPGPLVTDPAVAAQAKAFYSMVSQGRVRTEPEEPGPSTAPGAKPGFGDTPPKAGDPF